MQHAAPNGMPFTCMPQQQLGQPQPVSPQLKAAAAPYGAPPSASPIRHMSPAPLPLNVMHGRVDISPIPAMPYRETGVRAPPSMRTSLSLSPAAAKGPSNSPPTTLVAGTSGHAYIRTQGDASPFDRGITSPVGRERAVTAPCPSLFASYASNSASVRPGTPRSADRLVSSSATNGTDASGLSYSGYGGSTSIVVPGGVSVSSAPLPVAPKMPMRSAIGGSHAAAPVFGSHAAAMYSRQATGPAIPMIINSMTQGVSRSGYSTQGSSSFSTPKSHPRATRPVSPTRPVHAPRVISPTRTAGPTVQRVPSNSEVIKELLKERAVLKRAVVQCFKRAADDNEALNMPGLLKCRDMLVQILRVPAHAFGDLASAFPLFDFDGNGWLEVNEVYKMVKFQFIEQCKKSGCETYQQIPRKSVAQAGYKIIKELGRGAQGVVNLVHDSVGNEMCVKQIAKANMCPAQVHDLYEEFETLQLLACERIAQVSEMFQDAQFYYMVGEAYTGGDLTKLRLKASMANIAMTGQWWKGIFVQLIEALAFMHEQAMIHCDIKEPNIMIKRPEYSAPQVVLIDFGVSKAMVATGDGNIKGTPGYLPPETYETGKWYPKGDIFSMGVCMVQLLTDKIPPDGLRTLQTPGGIFIEGCATLQDIQRATATRQPPFHLLPSETAGLNSILPGMLAKRMQDRMTALHLLEESWFQEDSVAAPKKLKGLHNRATCGITKSFLATLEDNPEDTSVAAAPALAAIHEIRQMHGVSSASDL